MQPASSTPVASRATERRPWSLGARPVLTSLAGVSAVYLGIRLVAGLQATFLEDHDSTRYLYQIDRMLTEGVGAAWGFRPDAAPFYPLASVPLSALFGSAEIGARLTSLAFSLLLLVALIDIGRRMAPPLAVAAGILLLSFNPTMVGLSYAVLTEMSFVAVFYVAAWIFWIQFDNPRPGLAALLGCVAALAFVNRVEGLLLLGLFPALQVLHYRFFSDGRYSQRQLLRWSTVLVLCFGAVASIELARVSSQMGRLALNGRQAWVAILSDGERGYEEAIYGLDYDPGTTNIDYVLANPAALSSVEEQVDPRAMARRFVFNLDELLSTRLGGLVGAVALALFGLGLFHLWSGGRRFETVTVLALIATGVTAPLVYSVSPRHVAVVVPIILLIAGMGVGVLANGLFAGGRSRWSRYAVAGLAVGLASAAWAYPLSVPLRGLERPNFEYHPADFSEPISIVRSLSTEADDPPVIISRRAYFPYYAGAGVGIPLPYTDYAGLVEYGEINHADFLYLVRDPRGNSTDNSRPFLVAFADDRPPEGFELLYRGRSSLDQGVELYRFVAANVAP